MLQKFTDFMWAKIMYKVEQYNAPAMKLESVRNRHFPRSHLSPEFKFQAGDYAHV